MSFLFEILVFENHDLYDSDIANQEDVVTKFVAMCRTYVNPEYAEERYTCLSKTNKTITYSDRNGNDKPKLVMLIGPVTLELNTAIRAEIKKFYHPDRKCDDCGVSVEPNRVLCRECAENQ